MPDQKHIIFCIDVGGSTLRGSIAEFKKDRSLKLALELPVRVPVESTGTKEAIFTNFSYLFEKLLRRCRKIWAVPLVVEGLAIAFPGPFDYQAGVPYVRNLGKYEAIYEMNITPELSNKLKEQVDRVREVSLADDVRIVYENDARLFTYGAWLMDKKPALSRIAGLTLGTGCGSGFIIDGRLIDDGAVAEFQELLPRDGYVYHLPLDDKTVDDWLSTRGLVALAHKRGIEAEDGLAVAELAAGSEAAREVYLDFGRKLRVLLDQLMERYRAQRIYLGGRIAQSMPLMELGQTYPVRVNTDPNAPLLGAAGYWMERER